MTKGVVALQAAAVIGGSALRQAIGIAGGDVQGVEDPEAILQVWHLGGEGLGDGGRQIAERTAEAMAPALLAVVKMQGLQGFCHRLMAGETSPLVVAGAGAELGLGLGQVGQGLMQSIGGAIHGCSLVQGEGAQASVAGSSRWRAAIELLADGDQPDLAMSSTSERP